ncbi:hypothetical protein XENOCAPTIV_021311 [Xenoophorus captivus]|uniref:Uncharacterized protein n=1 Tax=Xenoophorus captivus TaxID=1517983 RepID=A0ABV0S1Q5_9TELE
MVSFLELQTVWSAEYRQKILFLHGGLTEILTISGSTEISESKKVFIKHWMKLTSRGEHNSFCVSACPREVQSILSKFPCLCFCMNCKLGIHQKPSLTDPSGFPWTRPLVSVSLAEVLILNI